MKQLKSVPIGGTGKTHKWSWQIEEEKRQKEEDEEMEKWCVICNNNGHVRLVIYQNNLFSRCFSKKSIPEGLRGPSIPKMYFWRA